MKKSFISVPAAESHGHFPIQKSLSDRLAAFSFLGFWQTNKAPLLLAAAAVALAVIFVIWISRRRRRESLPLIPSQAFAADVVEMDLTQVESQPATEARRSASPGIHGKIEVVIGSQQISSYLITDNPLLIGRDPSQSLVIIQEPIVSKLHCQVYSRAGKVFVKDLNSTNGVYVNEEKVGERELQDNDVVFLGKKGTVKIIYHQ